MLDLGLIDEISMMYGYGIVEEQDGIVWMRYLVKQDM
jgi:hypothetical protein